MSRVFSERVILPSLLLVALVFLAWFKLPDYDTWFHLAYGREVWQRGWLPEKELFNYPIPEEPMHNGDWLYGPFLYLLWHLGGAGGIILGRIALILSAFVLLFKDAYRGKKGLYPTIMLLFLCALATRERFYDRPDLFMFLFIALFLYSLNSFILQVSRIIYLLPFIQILWINLHASGILGPFLVGTYLGIGAFQTFIKSRLSMELGSTPGGRQLKVLGIILALVLLVILINPNGFAPFQYAHGMATMRVLRDEITELQPLTPGRLLSPYGAPYGIILVMLPISFLLAWRRASLIHLTLAAAFIYLSTGALRFVPLSAIVCTPVIVRNLASFSETPFWARVAARLPAGRGLLKGAALFLMVSLMVAGTIWHINLGSETFIFGLGVHPRRFPEGALSYLEQNHIQGNMYNTFHFGGYIAWRAYPERKTFIDGRGALPQPLLEKALVARAASPLWQELERSYGIDYAILDYPRIEQRSTFQKISAREDWGLPAADWALVYFDDAALVYLKRTDKFATIIQRDEYRYVLPANDYTLLEWDLKDKDYNQKVVAELQRALSQNPDNMRARAISGFAYNQRGDYQKGIAVLEPILRLRDAKAQWPEALMGLAYAYARLGQGKKAISYYEGIRKGNISGDNPQLLLSLAQLYQKEKDYQNALSYLLQAIKRDGRFLMAYAELEKLYTLLGDKEAAKAASERYQRALAYGQGEFHFGRGLELTRQKQIHEAVEEYKESIRVNPYNPAAHSNLGYLYYDIGILDKALAEQLEAIRINPDWAEAHYGLALIYQGRGEYERARDAWNRYLELRPRGYWSRKAREALSKLDEMGH